LHIVLPTKETTFFMKKITYIFALLALTACSNDDVINTTSSNEIRLNVTANPISRAMTHHESYRTNNINYFRLWANLNNSTPFQPYFKDQRVSQSSGVWSLDTPYYWPDGNKLDFWAYHNEATDGSVGAAAFNADGKLEVAGITLPVDASKQDDALYAYASAVSKDDNGGTVSLNLRHALSMMEFRMVNKSENVVIEVQKVTVTGLRQKGSFYIDNTTPTQYLFDAYKDNTTATNSNDNGGTNEGKYYPYSTDIHWFANYGEQTANILNEKVPLHNPDGEYDHQDQYCYSTDDETSYIVIFPSSMFATDTDTDSSTDTDSESTTHVKTDNSDTPVIGKMLVLPLAMQDYGKSYKNMQIKISCRIYSIVDMDGFKTAYQALADKTPEAVHALLSKTETTDDDITTNTYASTIYADQTNGFADSAFREFYIPLPLLDTYFLQTEGTEYVSNRFVPGIRYVYNLIIGGDGNETEAKTDDGNELMTRVRVKPNIDYWPATGTTTSLSSTTKE
jgi:hypothetical protein